MVSEVMSTPFSTPVADSVPKINNDVAVGENLDFQRKWWRFERAIWIIFVIILICDVAGLFGRGWVAKAVKSTADQSLRLDYERIARASTPSVMTLNFTDAAIHDGTIKVYVSDSVVRPLGAQRIAPQPLSSVVGDGGITYTFPATHSPAVVQIALEPSFPGLHKFRLQVIGNGAGDTGNTIDASVFVVP